jgi:adhesin/invasin
MAFTDTKAETVTLTARAGGTDAGQSKTSSFVADTTTAHVSMLTIDTDGSVANGTAKNSATATVVDSQNNILPNTTVNWTVTGSAGLTSGTSTTNGSGQAVMAFTDTKAETVTLTARAGGTDAGQSKTSSFVAPAPASVVVTITKDGSVADGTTANTAQALVKDALGNPLSDVVVNWSVNKNAEVSGSQSTTDSNGIAIISIVDMTAETAAVKATVNSLSNSANTTFVGMPVDSLELTVTVDGHGIDSGDPDTVVVTAYDVNHNPLPDVHIALSDNSTANIQYFPSSGMTSNDGTISFNIMSNLPGGAIVTATTTNATGAEKTDTASVHFASSH